MSSNVSRNLPSVAYAKTKNATETGFTVFGLMLGMGIGVKSPLNRFGAGAFGLLAGGIAGMLAARGGFKALEEGAETGKDVGKALWNKFEELYIHDGFETAKK